MSHPSRHVRSRTKRGAPLPRNLEVEIAALGGRGDGIASHQGEPVFVPYTVPGDRVVVRIDGRRGDGLVAWPLQVLTGGPGRVEPPCRHFGRCGGCSLQHLDGAAYVAWKRGLLVEALARAGFDCEAVGPLLCIAPGSRRRAAFAFARRRGRLAVGFNTKGSHEVVDLAQCRLVAPQLIDLLPPLRDLLPALIDEGREGDAVASLTEAGIDLLVEADARLDLFDRERLAAFADSQDLARLSWRRPGGELIEPLACRRPPVVRFAGVGVVLPPGGFLQPSREGEDALASLVVAAIGTCTPVADLYAGCGSFTFPLARMAAVHAVEGDAAALRALSAAAGESPGRVTTENRDLARRPLSAEELKRFQAVVFDPPRVGAAAQAEILAAAGPPLIVAVSCNPATLARDARILAKGGYRLRQATPVDQFPWSAHLEAVAVFER